MLLAVAFQRGLARVTFAELFTETEELGYEQAMEPFTGERR